MGEHWNQLCATYAMAREDAQEEVSSDEECTLLGTAHSDATWSLLIAPAPDLEALAYKLEIFRDEEMYELTEDRVGIILQAMIADARRLQEGRADG